MIDPRIEAKRIQRDPEYLRKKAAYLMDQARRGGVWEKRRLARSAELLAQAESLDHDHGEVTG